ncbi:MAG: zinc ribbon domain-containing protein [Clostridia bacterium]|nr:zinc ribbon domain-containing protein [Clostridia bacterium]
MANCPKCGKHLKLTDWKPNCPHCGVNITYYGLEEKLQEEADVAELEHAKVQKKIDRLRTSFVGSPLTIIRIIMHVICLGMLMLPLCSVTYSGPFIEQTTEKINGITLYNTVSSLDFDALFAMFGSKLVGTGFTGYFVALICTLLSAVMVLVSLIALVAAMGPKGNIRNIFNNSLSVLLAIAGLVAFKIFSSNIHGAFPEFFSGKVMFGAYIYIIAIAALLALNIYLTINKVEVKYKQCYVGGIPVEEYEEELAKGTSMEVLHARMDVILAEKAAERRDENARKEAERKAKEEEELARKAGKS